MPKRNHKLSPFLVSLVFGLLVISFLRGAFIWADDDEEEEEWENYYELNEPTNDDRPSLNPTATEPVLVSTPTSAAAKPNDNIIISGASSANAAYAAALAALKDSDQDGLPDNLDKHPGEDDYAYYLLDQNNNGLGDDLELLLK